MRLAFVVLALVPASSALRLPATRLPSRRLGKPVAQVSPNGDGAASTAGKGVGSPRRTDAAAALRRGQQALEQSRATAKAQARATVVPAPVLRWDERARASVWRKLQPWVPNLAVLRREMKPALKRVGLTQNEKARAHVTCSSGPYPAVAAPLPALGQTPHHRDLKTL